MNNDYADDPDWEQQLVDRDRNGFVSDEENEAAVAGDEENEDTQETPVVSVQEAARMVAELRQFGVKNNKPEIVDAMLDIERSAQQVKFDKIKKSKHAINNNKFLFLGLIKRR